MEALFAVILAAGEGKRMKTKHSKMMHEACGKPLIDWVIEAVAKAGINNKVVVVGHKSEEITNHLKDNVQYAYQKEQLGTGHAVMQAVEFIKGKKGTVLVLCGDTPLISPDTISDTVEYHKKGGFAATVITAELDEPFGYGRIIREPDGSLRKIVEQRDATEKEREIREINSGIYCFDIDYLDTALNKLGNDNDQGEYYLTDTLEILIKMGKKVGALKIKDPNEIMGINDRVQLSEASDILRQRILKKFMRSGVTIIDPKSTYISDNAEIGIDTVIYPGTIIEGAARIGEDCTIGPNSRITASVIGNGTVVSNSVIVESKVGDLVTIGPFAYIRPGCVIENKVKVGDFVEIKNSHISEKTKLPHLAYIGDSDVGRNCNIACGVITVNYDGKTKSRTTIGDNVFVGCNVNLIAPVEIKSNSYIAAGSTITDVVPEYSLAIARERQTIKDNWINKKGMQRIEKD